MDLKLKIIFFSALSRSSRAMSLSGGATDKFENADTLELIF